MNTRLLRCFHSFPGTINVIFGSPCQSGYGWIFHCFSHSLYCCKISRRSDGKAGFNHIYAKLLKRYSEEDVLRWIYADSDSKQLAKIIGSYQAAREAYYKARPSR